MRILVTGSTGFVGGALCRALVEKGHQVRAFHRSSSNLRLLEGLDVEHVVGDLSQTETILPAVQGMEVVFHAAAQLESSRRSEGRMYAVTVEGTRAVLQAARFAGVQRVVHTSSVAALGVPEATVKSNRNSRDQTTPLLDENHTWNYPPNAWMYGYTKYLAELEVQRAVAQGLDVVIVNPTVVIGPGDIHRQSSSLVVQVAHQKISVMVDGGLNVVHIDDVVTGHLAALEHGKIGQRYILGGENLSLPSLIQTAARIAGVAVPQVILPSSLVRSLALPVELLEGFLQLPASPSLFRMAGIYFYYAIRKSQTELGLPPPHTAEESLRDAYEWFKEVKAI